MSTKSSNLIFSILLFLDFLLLVYVASGLSITQNEVNIYFSKQHDILWYLTHISTNIFGNTNIALRFPFILFYIASIIVAYLLTDDYFTKPIDRLISIIIFMLLPGVNSAALLIDNSIIVVFCTLLYLYLFKLYSKEYYILLVLFLFIDNSFAILFLALFFYALKKKDNILLVVSLVLFGISMQMYGFEIGGHPRGYFLDTFAIYASIFSPILFLYFFYTIYRVAIKEEKDLYWYIASTSLGLSLVFSLRQKIDIEDFAPFVVIAIPLMVKIFLHSFRVRLKIFRKNHYRFAKVMLSVLMINVVILLFNKPLYFILNNPEKHFAYKFHIVADLAKKLKQNNINNILCNNTTLQKQLKFYGITKGNKYYLTDKISKKRYKKIDINYYNKLLKRYYVTKLNI